MNAFSPFKEITEEEWTRVSPLFPERNNRRGRPVSDTRSVLNGVLWVMYSGVAWSEMPRIYPPHTTCHRRFKAWCKSGVFGRVINELPRFAAESLRELLQSRTRGDWAHPFIAACGEEGNPGLPGRFERITHLASEA